MALRIDLGNMLVQTCAGRNEQVKEGGEQDAATGYKQAAGFNAGTASSPSSPGVPSVHHRARPQCAWL